MGENWDTVPNVSDGNYDIFLTATDQLGNQGNAAVSFAVDNTPPASSTSSNNNCGAVALANLLGGLGITADAGTIASIAGTDESGTSFYGLIEAAKQFGVDLHGVSLDSSQLQAGDIVLLNMGGVNHYGIILGTIGDYVILQDPVLGTVVLSLDQFDKFYTGYALTLRDVGASLGFGELQSLSGGKSVLVYSDADYDEFRAKLQNLTPEQKETIRSLPVWNPDLKNIKIDPLLALFLGITVIGVFIILTGGFGAVILPLIPFAGEAGAGTGAATGAAEAATAATAATATAEASAATAAAETAAEAGLLSTLIELLPSALRPAAREIIRRGIPYSYTAQDWFFRGFSAYSRDGVGITQILLEIIGPRLPVVGTRIFSLVNNPVYVQQGFQYNLLGLADYFNKPPESRSDIINNFIRPTYDNHIRPTIDTITNTYDNLVKSAMDRFNKEKQEFQQKGLEEYAKSKVQQAKSFVKENAPKVVKYYNNNIKPWVEHNVKPVAHKYLDQVWNNPVTQWAVKNVPGVRHVTNALGWIGNALGIW